MPRLDFTYKLRAVVQRILCGEEASDTVRDMYL